MSFYNFLVYDTNTKILKYSKYNFDFVTYHNDNPLLSIDKNIMFAHFWQENNYSYIQPFEVYSKFEKYFTPMTDKIRNYVSKYGNIHSNFLAHISPNISYANLIQNQFDLIEYAESDYRRIQDFLYTVNTNYTYTKYNFDFDTYSVDFKIFDNKLVIFTDFIIRNYNTSGVIVGSGGTGFNYIFDKYFKKNINMEEYLFSSSINSILNYSDKNYYNIDFVAYYNKNLDIPRNLQPSDIIEHYLRFGQFEINRPINFIQPNKISISLTRSATCSVFLKNKSDSPLAVGFLYNYPNDNNYYLVTVYHLIKHYRDQRYVYGIFENNNTCDIIQFKIIGYDLVTDILVAIYDHTLNFNIVNNINITLYSQISINYNYKALVSETVSMIGNIGFDDNLSYIDGKIINTRYSGGFNIGSSVDTIPESILIQGYGVSGMSGSPVLKGDPLGSNIMDCIGMVVGGLKTSQQITIAIDGYLLGNIVQTMIHNWNLYIVQLNITNQESIDNFVKNGFPKTWLGITNQYNHPISSKIYKELSNLSYVGGLLITNFIIGFNVRDEKFVFSSNDLVDRNVIKFQGPLLKTTLYNRFITNGGVPILITHIRYFDCVSSSYVELNVGKFGSQNSYSDYVYGNTAIASYELPGKYYNPLRYEFGPIRILYYYYNGTEWIQDSEQIGGNTSDWYTTYTDNADNKYYQHLFEFPQILIPYIHDYSIAKYSQNSGINSYGFGGSLNKYGAGGSLNTYGSDGVNPFGSGGVNPFGSGGVNTFGANGIISFGNGGSNF
jgi:hypothetical protein